MLLRPLSQMHRHLLVLSQGGYKLLRRFFFQIVNYFFTDVQFVHIALDCVKL